MPQQINHQTELTNDNMSDTDSDFFSNVTAYITENSVTGDPDQSLMDWLSAGDYDPTRTVGSVIAEWDGDRE